MIAGLSMETGCCKPTIGAVAVPRHRLHFGCRQAGVGRRGSRQLDAALKVAEQLKRPILRMPDKEELAAMDRLIMEVASPRTKRTLTDYRNENKVREATHASCVRESVLL